MAMKNMIRKGTKMAKACEKKLEFWTATLFWIVTHYRKRSESTSKKMTDWRSTMTMTFYYTSL